MRKPRKFGPHGRNFVREWREFRGLSAEQLGEEIGMEKGGINKIENSTGGILLKNLYLIAEALDCTVADLVGRPPDQDPELAMIYDRASAEQRQQIAKHARVIVDQQESGQRRRFPNRK